MAVNPQLVASQHGHGPMPVPFPGELFLLHRDNIHMQLDRPGQHSWSAHGALYLSPTRLVFVSAKPDPAICALDMPLVYLSRESFNQPIFGSNNLSGQVYAVPDGPSAPPYEFKLYFQNGGVGTFLPLFFTLLGHARAHAGAPNAAAPPPPPVAEILRTAFIDPNDPTVLYIPQGPGGARQPGAPSTSSLPAPQAA